MISTYRNLDSEIDDWRLRRKFKEKMNQRERDEANVSVAKMEDMTPKRAAAIVQPIPRRIVPLNIPTHSVAPWQVSRVEPPHGSNVSQSSENLHATDDSESDHPESSFSSSGSLPTEENGHFATGFHPISFALPTKTEVDFSAKRVTAFRVSDLLGDGISAKKDTHIPSTLYPIPTYLPLKPLPVYPPSVMMMTSAPETNISHELLLSKRADTPPIDEDVSQKNLPVGDPGSLTSSPISPNSESSTSDSHTDHNSSTDRETSPLTSKGSSDKKSNRINYTPVQVRRLEKVFLETPYPEHELYEQLSKDLSIPEPRLKVWFQNKRARWKRRVEDKITYPYPYPFSMAPMGIPYGMMPGSVTSPPDSGSPSIFSYPASPSPMMLYPGAGYPSHMYPYLNPQMFVQQ